MRPARTTSMRRQGERGLSYRDHIGATRPARLHRALPHKQRLARREATALRVTHDHDPEVSLNLSNRWGLPVQDQEVGGSTPAKDIRRRELAAAYRAKSCRGHTEVLVGRRTSARSPTALCEKHSGRYCVFSFVCLTSCIES